jgi:hypothetical protein
MSVVSILIESGIVLFVHFPVSYYSRFLSTGVVISASNLLAIVSYTFSYDVAVSFTRNISPAVFAWSSTSFLLSTVSSSPIKNPGDGSTWAYFNICPATGVKSTSVF